MEEVLIVMVVLYSFIGVLFLFLIYLKFFSNRINIIHNVENPINVDNDEINQLQIRRAVIPVNYQNFIQNDEDNYNEIINESITMHLTNIKNKLKKYPLVKLKNHPSYDDNIEYECAISLEDIDEEEMIYLFKCFHIFKCFAIENWLKNNTECPICREKILD